MPTEIFGKYEKDASRLELFLRIPYGIAIYIFLIIIGIALWFGGIAAMVLTFVNCWYILILGKRWKFANKWVSKYINFSLGRVYYDYVYNKVVPYFMLLTDERPGFDV